MFKEHHDFLLEHLQCMSDDLGVITEKDTNDTYRVKLKGKNHTDYLIRYLSFNEAEIFLKGVLNGMFIEKRNCGFEDEYVSNAEEALGKFQKFLCMECKAKCYDSIIHTRNRDGASRSI